jgi:A/G-specific adenine glycosylase
LQNCVFFCTFAPILELLSPLLPQKTMVNSLLYSHLYRWYEANRRILPWRETEDPYCIWLSEVILQQTRVAQGMDYYLRFVSRWRTVEELAAADEAEVLREWQGLGYYSRARNLHKAAQTVVANGWTPFPKAFDDIRALPGIGDYTAGAIASFAYNMPYPAMDGNVYGVMARLLDIDELFDTTAGKRLFQREIEQLLKRSNPRLFNSAIMEFGALCCTPVLGDNCLTCPLSDVCLAHAHGTAELLPVRKPRPKLKDRWLDYHIYVQRTKDNGQWTINTLLRRRENPKDIWYHLYEFPCEEQFGVPDTENRTQTESAGAQSAQGSKSAVFCTFTHVLSHQRIHARFILHKVAVLPAIEGAIRVPWSDLDDYALARLTVRAIDTLRSFERR